jgi:phosphatidylglycerophosphate synthase
MNVAGANVIVVAEGAEALTQVCGISILERLLRTLQRLGVRKATVIASRDSAAVAEHLAVPSWARSELEVSILSSLDEQLGGKCLVIAAAYYDSRLLAALLNRATTTVLVDSSAPSALQPLLTNAERNTAGYLCRAALLEGEWLARAREAQSILDLVNSAANAGAVAVLDVNQLPGYVVGLRRHVRPLWFPSPALDLLLHAERLVLDAAQNGTLDLPAKLHAPIETWIIARLCRTSITPMQITLFTAAVSAGVTVLFASGNLLSGTLLALAVGILDGLDGKQARVKVETTELGKREHLLDYVLELSWWSALAYYFTSTHAVPNACAFLALLVGADLVDRIAKKHAKQLTGRNLDDVAPMDRFVRLIGGRRNIYIWMFAAGLALRAADKAFIALCCWGALTAAVHVLRVLWLNRQFRGARGKGAAH